MSEFSPGEIIPFEDVAARRAELVREGVSVVVTNGCFDILHVGHLRYLQNARALGDRLWVGITDDAGVAKLKGPSRPVNPQDERAEMLASLRAVDLVTVFPFTTAEPFLEVVRPDVYAKGGDYTIETVNQDERRLLEGFGARIEFLQLVPGRSTSRTIARMRE